MLLKPVDTISSTTNLAYILSHSDALPEVHLKPEEQDYLEGKKEETETWISINQYNRWIFVYRLPDETIDYKRTEKLRKAGAALAKRLNAAKQDSVTVIAGDHGTLVAEGMYLGNYQYLRYFSEKNKKENSLKEVHLLDCSENEIGETMALCRAVCYARDLVNTPVWDLTALDLAESATAMAKEVGFSIEVFNKKKIEALKMGGLLAVNKGSLDPPTFIIMEYKPAKPKNKKPLVIVGKGVVYDTGGLSLKPTSYMDDMKSDMGGAAAVIGTMTAIAAAQLDVHVIGLTPATDNRPAGNAVTPGDVITISDGTTVEVMNTDAEGRLILSDALHYAKKYDPELVIDLATLTGSAAMALGRYGIVGMGKADENAWNKLKNSGEATYERVVEFPFWEEYDELLKSPIADLKNIGGREGGAITAGKFLANFTDYPYIHLDIAGPAFIKTNDGYLKKGATGVGVRLLFDFFKNY